MDSESFNNTLQTNNYLKKHRDYAIMREIFNQNNISMMLDKGLKPEEYMDFIVNQKKSILNLSNITNVIDKQDIDIVEFLIRIKARIKYISSGTTGHFFQGAVYYYFKNGRKRLCSFAMKVTGYVKNPHYKTIYQITRPENTEINMMSILSRLIIEGKTVHLLLPIKTYYSDIKPFIKMYKNQVIKPENDKNKKYKDFVERYDNGQIENTVSILIYEFANGGDFLKFVKANHHKLTALHWKIFVFQLLSVLAVIQERYPDFRHNDLKANNILVELTKSNYENIDHNIKINYNICGKKYQIPDSGIIIKMWDFDFACIPKICDNIKVHETWTKKLNITPEKNQYYDIHYFFRTLINNAFFPDVLSNNPKYQELKKFISDVLPGKYIKGDKLSKYGRLLINDEYTTPKKLLENNPYFEEFRI